MMRPSTFFFLTRRGVRNLGKHWAMTIACIASLSVCMTLNIFASLAEVNVGSMVAYLGSQNETVVYLDPECDDATAAQVGETLSAMPGVSGVQYVSKQDVLDTYRGYMQDYSSLWDEFETDNPFKANYRVTLSDLTQMERMSVKMQAIPGVVSVTAPVEMTNIFVEIQKAVTKGGRMIVLVLMVVSIITVVRSSSMPSISWRISLARLPIMGRSSGASLPIMRIRPVIRPLRPSSSTRAASSLAASSALVTSSLASSSSLTRSSIRLMSSLSSLAYPRSGTADTARCCGCAARFGNKKPPSGMCIAQGRLNSAVPPCLTRRMSGPPRPLFAPCREAHGFPTGDIAAAGRAPVEVAARE